MCQPPWRSAKGANNVFKSNGPITFPCGINAGVLQGVQVFENPVDYKQVTGKDAPWDPNLPVKNWIDTDTSRTQVGKGNPNPYAGATYNIPIPQTVIGPAGIPVYNVPVITPCFVPGFMAAAVNIPPLGSGAGVAAESNADKIFPLDPSIVQANLVVSPWGVSLQAAS